MRQTHQAFLQKSFFIQRKGRFTVHQIAIIKKGKLVGKKNLIEEI